MWIRVLMVIELIILLQEDGTTPYHPMRNGGEEKFKAWKSAIQNAHGPLGPLSVAGHWMTEEGGLDQWCNDK